MSAATVTRRPMSADELANVVDLGGRSWVYAILETFWLFGVDLTDPDCPNIRPGDYQIPSDQWGAIAASCGQSDADRLAGANHMLDWMNYGPGSYDPPEASS